MPSADFSDAFCSPCGGLSRAFVERIRKDDPDRRKIALVATEKEAA